MPIKLGLIGKTNTGKTTFFNSATLSSEEISSSIIKFLNYKDGLDVILCSDVPGGSGLGASSSLAVNLINTINFMDGKKFNSKKEILKNFCWKFTISALVFFVRAKSI